MVQLLLLFIFGLAWWVLAAYIPDWNFHRRPVREMSTKKLRHVYYHWFNGYAFQDHGAMFYVQKKYMKASSEHGAAIMIVAYKRVLEIQEELLRREKPNTEKWQIDYVNRLLREIDRTKESLAFYEKIREPVPNQFPASVPAKAVTDRPASPQDLPSVQLNNEVLKSKEKKTPIKRKTTLFLESLEGYLLRDGTSPTVCAVVKQMVRKSKSIPSQPGTYKELLARKLYGYIEQASPHELDVYGEIIEKLLGYTESDT